MLTRRDLLAGSLSAATAAPDEKQAMQVCIFSKHLQWLSVPDAAGLAAEIGFDGIDLTVREDGHVLPARAADDLPKAVEAVRKAGLDVPMITAGIVDVRSPHAEKVLATARALGIRRYRWGGFRFAPSRPIPEQLAECQARARDLAALNRQYGICAMYHTHSGAGEVGASIWDLYLILKDLDTNAVAVNYDIGHATVEGGLGGWIHSTRLTLPMMRGAAVKDFLWEKAANGKWRPAWCPIGHGMVQLAPFFAMLRQGGFSGPVQLHFEYETLGGADKGRPNLTIGRKAFVKMVRGDLHRVRDMMREG
jgi:sugar phosphate isomerase/epimerase